LELLAAVLIFGVCMAGMGVGVIFAGRSLRGHCGGGTVHDADGDLVSCGVCDRQEADLCPSDEPLVRLSQITHPDPLHHR